MIARRRRQARELAPTAPLASLIGRRSAPWPGSRARRSPTGSAARHVHYYHPVGTARMGADGDPLAVCDPTGRVHGQRPAVRRRLLADPAIPRANTNIPAVVVGERVAQAIVTAEGI